MTDCPICAEHRYAITAFLVLSADDRASIFRHARECDVLSVQVEAGWWQLVGKATARLLVRLALAGVLPPAPLPVAMAAEISLVQEV